MIKVKLENGYSIETKKDNRLLKHPSRDIDNFGNGVPAMQFVNWVKQTTFCDEQRICYLQNALYPGGDISITEAKQALDAAGIYIMDAQLQEYFQEGI